MVVRRMSGEVEYNECIVQQAEQRFTKRRTADSEGQMCRCAQANITAHSQLDVWLT
jgi:hypothetical protein